MSRSSLATIVALAALSACRASSSATEAPAIRASDSHAARNVGILVFDGVFITEFSAPFDTYKHVGQDLNVFTVAPRKDAITTYEGVRLQPDYAFGSEPRIDVLVVPSGIHSIDTDLDDAAR